MVRCFTMFLVPAFGTRDLSVENSSSSSDDEDSDKDTDASSQAAPEMEEHASSINGDSDVEQTCVDHGFQLNISLL